MDKRKRGEGENMLGDRLQDNISARAETRGFSEQQAGSQDAGRLSNATMPPVGTYNHMLRHSLMNENTRALPVGALATYALRILNSTALTRSTVSCRCPSARYRAANLDLRLTRVAILQNSPTHFLLGT